jgi:hypothetical protein
MLLRYEDGTEAWHDVEDLEQVLSPAHAVVEGDEVINAHRGTRGKAKETTASEILVLHDDGSEEWHGIEALGRAKSRADIAAEAEELFNEIDANKDGTISQLEFGDAVNSGILKDGRVTFEELESAKGNAREARMAALIVDEELEAAKDCARDALCTALLQGAPDEDLEAAKQTARDALMSALLSSGSDEELDVAKENARDALFAALLSEKANDEDLESAKENARAALFEALVQKAPDEELDAAKENARDALFTALLGADSTDKGPLQTAPSPASLVPFSGYYSTNFATGAPVDELARQLFKAQEPKSAPPPDSEKIEEPQPAASTEAAAAPKPSQAQSSASFVALEEKIRQRNDRFRIENDALRSENRRLKALWDKRQEADTSGVRKTGPDAS